MICPRCRCETANQSVCPYCGTVVSTTQAVPYNNGYEAKTVPTMPVASRNATESRFSRRLMQKLETELKLILALQCGNLLLLVVLLIVLAMK